MGQHDTGAMRANITGGQSARANKTPLGQQGITITRKVKYDKRTNGKSANKKKQENTVEQEQHRPTRDNGNIGQQDTKAT